MQKNNMIQIPFTSSRFPISSIPHLHSFHGEEKPNIRIMIRKRKTNRVVMNSETYYQTSGGQLSLNKNIKSTSKKTKRVFLLDVNPLCYNGNKPSLEYFIHWISLFFREVTINDPIIGVFDGERASEQRRQLLPSYKAHRHKWTNFGRSLSHSHSHRLISHVLSKCNVPLVRIRGQEADDVIATLSKQALSKEYKIVIASPDKDFKQLLSHDVQIVMPVTELRRWSFYTLKHYESQYKCDPCSDLSLRCILGDEVDGVPGIHHVAPGFGRKTALKLLKKHGSLENLLAAAAVTTVGKQYAQDALVKYADYLRTNYRVLSLKTDVDVHLQDEWLLPRDTKNDAKILSDLFNMLDQTNHKRGSFQSV